MELISQQVSGEPTDTAVDFATIDHFLNAPEAGVRQVPHQLWGFGGLHGGLVVAAMAAELRTAEPAGQLRSISGRLHRSVRDPFTVAVHADTSTRSTRSYSTRLLPAATEAAGTDAAQTDAAQTDPAGAAALASATALFGADAEPLGRVFSPTAPQVPGWQEGELFRPPPSMVPVGGHTEIRALGPHRPFAGGSTPTLTAWLRMVEDDVVPDELRLLFLVDALAPSYAATLTSPVGVPTVELAAHFSGAAAVSPWVLVEAHTTTATASGWVTETINVWGEDRTHLVEARQLRLVRPARTS